MGSLNKATLIGNLGQEPELKYLQDGTAVCNLSIATNESWEDSPGVEQTRTEWHDVVAWERLAEVVNQYLSKGEQVYVEGKIITKEWEDRDGNTRYSTQIRAQEVLFLQGGTDGGSSAGPPAGAQQPQNKSSGGGRDQGRDEGEDFEPDDELPF